MLSGARRPNAAFVGGRKTPLQRRISISLNQLILAAALYLALALNTLFFSDLIAALAPSSAHDWAFAGAAGLLVVALYVLVLTVFALPYVLKPVIIGLVLVAVGVTYFMREYGVVIDVNMARNTFETDAREAGDLLTTHFFLMLFGLGVLPGLLVAIVPVRWPDLRTTVAQNFRRGFLTGGIALALIGIFFASFSSFLREHKPLLLKLAPTNAISATVSYAFSGGHHGAVTLKAIATDAHKSSYWQTAKRPAVVVLVVGETARSDRFSLNGYGRKTNPELEKVEGLISYKGASSCGTDTAESVPCIFSGLGRPHFTRARADSREGLLDVVKRAGFEVLWRENQSGCKGACAHVRTETVTHEMLSAYCSDGECHDDILGDRLVEKIENMKSGGVIVLHMMGSHGPAYFKRYPSAFRRFAPTCETSQFSNCTDEEISNTYDNTILYSDHVLAGIIGKLSEASRNVDTAMLYASDHGESLGEHGLYLHGMPYALAPEAQTHIPMLLWMSKSYKRDFEIDEHCMAARAGTAVSHDNIFPTVLSMMGIETTALDKTLDLLAPCRAKPAAAATH